MPISSTLVSYSQKAKDDAAPHPGRLACAGPVLSSSFPSVKMTAPQWLENHVVSDVISTERTGVHSVSEDSELDQPHAFIEL